MAGALSWAMRKNRFGLSVALATPFTEDRAIDLPRLVAHGRQSLADGCTSLTVFGTTGEGASLGLNERQRALGALVGAGIDPKTQLVVGIAAASVEDAIAQGRAGLMLGCPSFLLAPPFYFKGAGDEGLFDWFAAVLTGARARRRATSSSITSRRSPRSACRSSCRPPEEGLPAAGHRREGFVGRLEQCRGAAEASWRPAHPDRRRAAAGPRHDARRFGRDQRHAQHRSPT